jgi:hypothetical protein
MLDKGRATLAGKNGPYHYACPLDERFLSFAGILHHSTISSNEPSTG